MSTETKLDLEAIEKRAEYGYLAASEAVAKGDVRTLITEVRALRAGFAALAKGLQLENIDALMLQPPDMLYQIGQAIAMASGDTDASRNASNRLVERIFAEAAAEAQGPRAGAGADAVAAIHAMDGVRCPECELKYLLWEGTATANILGPCIIFRDKEAEKQAMGCGTCKGLGRINFRKPLVPQGKPGNGRECWVLMQEGKNPCAAMPINPNLPPTLREGYEWVRMVEDAPKALGRALAPADRGACAHGTDLGMDCEECRDGSGSDGQ